MVNVNKKVQRIAKMCHEANREIQAYLRETVNPPWDLAPDDLKDSTYIGVLEALGGALPSDLHRSWMEERQAKGWVWGPHLDREAKIHPCLVPYQDLPLEQQLKDAVFFSIVNSYE